MQARIIPLADIDVPARRMRALSQEHVAALAESMRKIGLLQPITVRPSGGGRFALVLGAHRFRAAGAIGSVDIAAVVVEFDDDGARLAEIDENLIRDDLTILERAEHLAERKRLYLKLHPETAQGTAGGYAKHGSASETVSFAADTAAKVGVTSRVIEQDIQIAEAIPEEVRMRLHGTPAATQKTTLLALARLPEAAQRAVVDGADLTDKRAAKAAIDAARASATRRRKRTARRTGPRAVVSSRPDEVVAFVFALGIFHRFVTLAVGDVVPLLTVDEIEQYRRLAPSVRAQLGATDAAIQDVT